MVHLERLASDTVLDKAFEWLCHPERDRRRVGDGAVGMGAGADRREVDGGAAGCGGDLEIVRRLVEHEVVGVGLERRRQVPRAVETYRVGIREPVRRDRDLVRGQCHVGRLEAEQIPNRRP